MTPFIVAEVSRNWTPEGWRGPLICQQFEQVIETNRRRGYRLHSFQLHRLMVSPDEMNETIIAVFERAGDAEPWQAENDLPPDP